MASLDDFFEEVAAGHKAQAEKNDRDPQYQKALADKRAHEEAAASRTTLTEAESAADEVAGEEDVQDE